ncbi:ATP-binding protein [Allorhizobium terrae]|uniref:histidine kinase n=1 Tax=Allorhizobium terrae TaxID=1848972 RepID=A0A4S3ZT99_9HYPH|nr:HAMP domain-containing sensor histidine kinase [Allorhizobium terrae]THF48920.1 HAMP domain-containing histidine kinase [Allorhizobium terrae]
MFKSLRLRLAIASVVAIGVSLFLLWFAVGFLFIDYVGQQYHSEMSAITDTVTARLSVKNGRLEMRSPPSDPRFASPSGGRYWQVQTPDGRVMRSRSLWDVELPKGDMALKPPFGFGRVEGPGGVILLVQRSALEITDQGVNYPFVVAVAFPAEELIGPLDEHRARSQLVMLMGAGLLLLAAFLQALVVLRPFKRLRLQVADVRTGKLRQLDTAVPGEVMPLVEEINLLLGERETAIEKARARASDLAHGLKTPLTVLSQLVNYLPVEHRDEAFAQIDLVRQRADRQLQAARLGVEQMLATDLESLIGKLVKVLDPVARTKNIGWQVEVEPGLSVEADAADLAEALGNILDNAVKWASAVIHIKAGRHDDRVVIVVSDDGPGVPVADREKVLRRGEFLDTEQGGSGLGLAICSDIMAAYDGSVALETSDLGGLCVRLELPQTGGRRVPPHPV